MQLKPIACNFNPEKLNRVITMGKTDGALADVNAGNLQNVRAIGYNATDAASNSLVLGNEVRVARGTSAPAAKLEVRADFMPLLVLRLAPALDFTNGWQIVLQIIC